MCLIYLKYVLLCLNNFHVIEIQNWINQVMTKTENHTNSEIGSVIAQSCGYAAPASKIIFFFWNRTANSVL